MMKDERLSGQWEKDGVKKLTAAVWDLIVASLKQSINMYL